MIADPIDELLGWLRNVKKLAVATSPFSLNGNHDHSRFDRWIAAVEALRDAQAWRLIDSAPRDGTHILISGFIGNMPPERWVAEAGFDCETGHWHAPDQDTDSLSESDFYPPTHWMPLPEGPKS